MRFSALVSFVLALGFSAPAAAQTIIVIDYADELTPPAPAPAPAPSPPQFTVPVAPAPVVPPAPGLSPLPTVRAAQLEEPRIGRFARIGFELMGAAAGVGLSGALGYGLWAQNGCTDYEDDYYYDYYDYAAEDCYRQSLALGGSVIPFSTSLGVFAAGRASGGRGRYWATMLGSMAGTGIGGAIAFMSELESWDFDATPYALALPLGATVGAILAFELDHGSRTRRLQRQGAPPPVAAPTLSITPDGAVFGAAGTF